MAQSGYTPISLYFSATGAAVPIAGNLVAGELALNTNDGKLYYKNSSGVVTLLAGATAGPAGGSTTQVQYNNAGVLAGITGATTNGTALTLVAPVLGTPASGIVTNLTGTASININGTVGATTPSTGSFTTLAASGTQTNTGATPLVFNRTNANTPLIWQNNTVEKLRITSRGDASNVIQFSVANATIDALTFTQAGAVTIPGTLEVTGIVTMSAYGAGTATFSAAGVISSVSDETWKIKDGIPTDPDAMIQKLTPGYWFYDEEKRDTFGTDRQLGFYAQNVNAAIGPEAAPEPEEGKPWGYYDRSVLAVAVMSLQSCLTNIQTLSAKVAALEAR